MNDIYTISHRDWTEVENGVTYATEMKHLLTMPLMDGKSAMVVFPRCDCAIEFLGQWRKAPAFAAVTFRSDEKMIEQLQELADDVKANCQCVLTNYRSGGTFEKILSISDFIKQWVDKKG